MQDRRAERIEAQIVSSEQLQLPMRMLLTKVNGLEAGSCRTPNTIGDKSPYHSLRPDKRMDGAMSAFRSCQLSFQTMAIDWRAIAKQLDDGNGDAYSTPIGRRALEII